MRSTHLRGARTHNLRGVDLDLAPGELIAVCGPSGSGKSSLAFATLYAEGQRRYVESFSAYARQFLERLSRPPVDSLEPVPAAIAVDRQAPVKTSRSTVGTMTEIADYAKSLYARAAILGCRQCGRPVTRDDPERAADELIAALAADEGARVLVTYPLPVAGAEAMLVVRDSLIADGYRRVAIGDEVKDLDAVAPSEALASGPELAVVVDRARVRPEARGRLVEAIEGAMARSGGRADVRVEGHGTFRYSRGLHCAHCDVRHPDPVPGMFSFNSAIGACRTCRGFGRTIGVDWDRVFPDRALTLAGGAIRPWTGKSTQWERRSLRKNAEPAGVPLDVPLAELSAAQHAWLIEGDAVGWPRGWGGLRGWFAWLETRVYKMHVRVLLSRYRKYETCTACGGARLEPEGLAWRIAGKNIAELFALPVDEARGVLAGAAREHASDPASTLLFSELDLRLGTLSRVGLGYLTLDRASRTLSGGEAQRVALTSALGASLTGAMFVLDEPTVGLHPVDVERLFAVVRGLVSRENTVLVVEHDRAVLAGADRLIELGPGAGQDGGRVVFDGPPSALRGKDTATARALGDDGPVVRARRSASHFVEIDGARGHNLDGVDLRIPLRALTAITGVSGSGKSSLIVETLVPAVARALGAAGDAPLAYDALRGARALRGCLLVDQSSLGRTSRGNPATYLGVWDRVRQLFAAEPRAVELKLGTSAFSFNVAGGRCEACAGEGAETVEMQFLADVSFTCPECAGRRFVGPVLEVLYRGLSVADVLELTAAEMRARFEGDRGVLRRLAPLEAVGLGYLRLGQPLSTLSGGEAQRLRLAALFAEAKPGSMIVLDEPTAGLHHADVTPLIAALHHLVDRGDTVVVIEHDMRIAAQADHVIDLGPGAGAQGGRIVAEGTPEAVAAAETSTASHLASALRGGAPPGRAEGARALSLDPDDGSIRVIGARENNLAGVDVTVPRERLVVVTGPSGSGKSTLTFDVIFAEGQRRYLETLSAYARQHLPQLPRPDVDRVIGIPPTVSLEQRITRGGASSTVATITEVSHYLRLLWAKAGALACPDCGEPIEARSPRRIAEDVRERLSGELAVLAPVIRGRKGLHKEVLARARRDGFREARIDGELVTLAPGMSLDRHREHDVELVVERLDAKSGAVEAAVARAARLGEGTLRVLAGKDDLLLSTRRACPSCGRGFPELDPRFFSFNTRQGACPACEGAGEVARTIGRGKQKREVLEPCAPCAGTRLSPLARAVTVDGIPITEVLGASVTRARARISGLSLAGREAEIARAPLAELARRLAFLDRVGLGYLGLDRRARTLSGGETQRVRLAAQLGSGLTGLLYVLDEPTIGLHPRDTRRLLDALRELVSRGNTLLVVEHDEDTIRAADHVIDVGPGGGVRGGRIVAQGSPRAILADPASVTGAALGRPAAVPARRRSAGSEVPSLRLLGARAHNLRDADVRFPLGRLSVVTGVSGSGKSTLVREVLLPAVRAALGLVTDPPGAHRALEGAHHLARAVEVDQSPIGRTPRSVPATYVGVWDHVRALLSGTPEARARGYGPSRFSFNVAEGRCDACGGNGELKAEMAFLPDVRIPCERCGGRRFSDETLEVRYRGMSAGELLELDVEDAARELAAVPRIAEPLALLAELGLGYLKLGQPSNTLSGGEAQRLKLVAELGARASGATLYVLDEPTTGLHRDDVARLLRVLERFVDRGDTVVVIEHQPDVMLAADWIVDLGPEGGDEGGRVIAEGPPEAIAATKRSHTGAVLRALLSPAMGERLSAGA